MYLEYYIFLLFAETTKLLLLYRSFNVASPFSSQQLKAVSIIEGVNIWFLMIGAFIERSVSEKAHLNWFQILKDALTIRFRECLDTGSERGIFV